MQANRKDMTMHDMTWADVDREAYFGGDGGYTPTDPADRVQDWVENGYNLADKRRELDSDVVDATDRARDIRAEIDALREELTEVEDARANDSRTINLIDAFVEQFGAEPGEDAGFLAHDLSVDRCGHDY